MKNPLVSVIICFLNPGNWLTEAVESVIKQSYDNWELILVDDGSVADDSQIALNFAFRYPGQIIYVDHPSHQNMGLTTSRNKGIELSSGTIVAFLDADDFWYENKLVDQIGIFNDCSEAAMICEASRFWYSWEDPQLNDPIIHIGTPEGLYLPGTLNKRLYPLGAGQPPCPTGIIIRREALLRSGGFETSFSGIYQLYEDQAFLAKIYLTEKVYISAACNNKYRKHPDSLTTAADNPFIYKKVRHFFLDWLDNFINKKQFVDEELNRLRQAARE